MSSVRVVKPLPPNSLLVAIDRGAKVTMQEAREAVAPIVSLETPRRSGRMAAALVPKVRKVGTGYSLTVGAPRGARHGEVTVNQVVRWVNRGTGLYRVGPGSHKKIRSKRLLCDMHIPGYGWVRSVKGQHPDPFLSRIFSLSDPRVQEIALAGAQRAAREAERLAEEL